MVRLLIPAVERRLDKADLRFRARKRVADEICCFLKAESGGNCGASVERERFYDACESLLRDRNSERVLFYLPLRLLEDAPVTFREAYCEAWYRLLWVRDVRENFHVGDCFELDARPEGELERVVKCAHLTPWLLKFGYITSRQVLRILKENRDDEVLLRSFGDTWGYIRKNKILGGAELQALARETAHLPERGKQEPLYVSEKRLKWLRERDKSVELLTPLARLEGPFSDNIPVIRSQLEEIVAGLEPSEIVLVGGSQLKGYGTKKSDLDVWRLQQLEASDEFYPGSPEAAHIYLNTIWLGGEAVAEDLERIADRVMERYRDPAVCDFEAKRRAIERLESDLLQYRLLHKGFARFVGREKFGVSVEMDGDCPFYDDEYRGIATMLYAKYVWL